MEEVINYKKQFNKNVQHYSKQDFLTFVRLFAPTIVSDWQMGKHIEVISEKLKQLEAGTIKRLMVFLPPRSSKSVICSKLFPAWYIGRNPEHEILQSVIATSSLAISVGLLEILYQLSLFKTYLKVFLLGQTLEQPENGKQTKEAATMQQESRVKSQEEEHI